MHGDRSGRAPGSPRVLVIGAGISGILVGIRLRQAGIESFTILEKAETLGGTWRDNTYPGVACDVAAHLYVYSFEPNPSWRRHFATGPEIWEYYDRIARKYGIVDHIRYGTEATSARWTGAAWEISTADGETFEAEIIVTAMGRLHHPLEPDIARLDEFTGPVIHTARWDHDVATAGKRIGVVGTGSSATQLTVALADEVEKLTLFQRTAQWVLPVADSPHPLRRRVAFRIAPALAKRYYRKLASFTAARGAAATGTPEQRAPRDAMCRAALATVEDPVLRAKLTPNYEPGCKRMVISERFYEAVQKPTVEVVTEGIDHVEPDGIVTKDGLLHPLDVIVLATGFRSQDFLYPLQLSGEDGVTLDEVWADDTLNYRSVAIPHMPNLFMINGPYSPGGSASVVGIAEVQVGYVMQLIEHIARNGGALVPSPERSAELLAEVRTAASATVWGTGGCQSWYLDATGVPTINPIPLPELAEELAVPHWADFEPARMAE